MADITESGIEANSSDCVEDYAGGVSEAAELLGLKETELLTYMAGVEMPTPETLTRWAEAVGIEPKLIYFDEWGEQVEAAVATKIKAFGTVP